jgi:hypothetical protein
MIQGILKTVGSSAVMDAPCLVEPYAVSFYSRIRKLEERRSAGPYIYISSVHMKQDLNMTGPLQEHLHILCEQHPERQRCDLSCCWRGFATNPNLLDHWNICTRRQQHRREEERFIIQASAFKTPCRCEAEAHHILHRHAETTHQPGLILRSKGCIGTGWRYRCRCLSSFFLKIGDPFLGLVEFM